MKQWQTVVSPEGVSYTDGVMTIPDDPANKDYKYLQAAVDAGEAEILPPVEPTPEEEQEQAQQQAIHDATDSNALYQTLSVLTSKLDATTLSVGEATQVQSFILPWSENGVSYVAEQLCNYGGKTYRVVQPNTSQPGWEPPNVPALFAVYVDPDGPPQPWVQPAGAHDAYNVGNRVTHLGSTWSSTVASNVWEPGVFGWDEE